MSEKPISGALFPCFAVDRIGGGQVVVVYRGRHCQLAKPFLAKLNDMTTKFTERNIHVVAISADRVDRAEADAKEFGWPFEVGYGLTLDTMRAMGLYISEPALFALSTRGTAEVINISNAAFSLPDLAGLLAGITFIQNRDYAPGGTLE